VRAAKAPVLADRYRLDWRFFRPKIDIATERKVRKQLAQGVGILKVAKSLRIGTSTVQRISNERAISPRGAQQ
jgi:DNA invertase Pin-like site-specific DNA recombinase